MRRVARDTALSFDHRMLKGEWPCGLGVALGADRVLIGSRLQLLGFECAMRIVTVAAGQQPFIDLVMERLRERRFHFGVAGVAELRLRDLEQIRLALGRMHAVTVGTADFGVAVGGALEIWMCSSMTSQTALARLFRGSVRECKDFCFVTTARNVLGARPMATLTTLMRRPALRVQRRLPVRRLRPIVIAIFVTRLACV